ncbi:hypothetical protein RR46_14747 [Papilio xuthus]|uniref:Otopetrin-2 n=1 Tax=Papilio xuthus TaxID=66420 RepID=A0A194PDZ2_PAPXU|nr:hypothetical protein RR46_14747 [Papilio xuthus]
MVKNKEKSNQNGAGGKEWRERSEPLLAVPEDESELPPHTLPRLSVVLPCSSTSSIEPAPNKPRSPLSHGDESMTVVLSAFYAKLLIVLGLALPVTSTIQNELVTNVTSDIFTIYLYIVSMLFLAYTFYHLSRVKKSKDVNVKRTRYGSFYLHIGVAGFSVGSIIYSCLQIAEYFDLSGDCQIIMVALKPTLRILFMVAQSVFIFSYTDILDPMRGVVLDRFGLMHLIATNVCEWLNVIIQETRDDIIAVAYNSPPFIRYTAIAEPTKSPFATRDKNYLYEDYNSTNISENTTMAAATWSCNISNIITPLIRSANPYLRPCGVEYSLLCSIIIVVIWNDICTVPGSKPLNDVNSNAVFTKDVKQCCARVKSNNHFSVDCGSAHKGLFMGIAVLAGTIVSLMLFNGLFQKDKHVELALLQINIWETVLFVIMTIGSVIQSSCQSLLVLDAWSRRCAGTGGRPGRQLVTFLLVGNFALWLLNRVKNARAEYHPLQMEFFGVWAWTLITHVSVPLLVCYRFQATVCFYEIWKNSYKTKSDTSIRDDNEFELKNHVA